MVDQTAADFEAVSDRTESIAVANEQQTEQIQQISADIDVLSTLDVRSDL